MTLNFLSLPTELRYEIYKILIVRKHEVINPFDRHHALATTHGQNIYNLEYFDWDREADFICEFLDTIGEVNASHLKSICIAFLQLGNYGDHIGPTPPSIEILEKITSMCTNLKTLTLNSVGTNAIENLLAELEDPSLAAKILATVDASFKKISSLKEVVAEVSPDAPCPEIRKEMESLGWKFDETVEIDGSSPEDWGNDIFSDESEDDGNLQDEYDDGEDDDGDNDDDDDDGDDDDQDDVGQDDDGQDDDDHDDND